MNVGIDLGTTNSALAYIDPREAAEADFPPIHVLPIEQQLDQVRTGTLRTLPSFLYLSDPPVVGAYARDQGALVPTKTVHSAKSWLSNSEADRTAKILPWDSQEEGRVLSPVEASARYLEHLRDNWNRTKSEPLAEQQVVLTVPASFDEEARELTVQAARDAGIQNLTLLEEPAAAFYAWIAGHLSRSNKELFDKQLVLICDVGGGTSDFTLVRVDREGDRVQFTRTTVGPASSAGRRQSRFDDFVAGGIQVGEDTFAAAAECATAAMFGGERNAVGNGRSDECGSDDCRDGFVVDRRHVEDDDHTR